MQRRFKRVVLFGIDGAGAFFKDANTPNIDKIFGNGSVTYNGVTVLPSISGECWGSMLYGVDPEVHGITNSSIGLVPAENRPTPSVFKIIKDNYPDAVIASFVTWRETHVGIIEKNVCAYTYDNMDERVLTDKVIEYVENNDFDVLFIMYEKSDSKGHHNGYGSPVHLAQIELNDSYIGEIYDVMAKRNMVDDTLFLITPDHGGTPHGNHGSDSKEELTIMMGAGGNGIVHGEMAYGKPISVKSITTMMLYGLGIPIPDYMTANVPENVFENFVEPERKKVQDIVRPKEELVVDGSLRTPVWFEGSMLEYMNHDLVETIGEITFDEGIIRESADFSKGYVMLRHYKFGVDNFAIGIRVKYHEFKHDEILFSNAEAGNDNSNGFNALLTKDGVTFRIGNGKEGQIMKFDFPHEKDKWFSFIVSVNRKENKIMGFFNYEFVAEYEINDGLKKATLDAYDLGVGMDGAEKFPNHLEALLSEMYTFRVALTKENVKTVMSYYN